MHLGSLAQRTRIYQFGLSSTYVGRGCIARKTTGMNEPRLREHMVQIDQLDNTGIKQTAEAEVPCFELGQRSIAVFFLVVTTISATCASALEAIRPVWTILFRVGVTPHKK